MAEQDKVIVERDLRLDLFRGIGLWMIFLDHIPHDVVSWLTLRNYGFSDAAEFFVFISGYLAGFIYGPIIKAGHFLSALKRLWKRAMEMYVAHIMLFLIFTAQIARTVRKFDNPMYEDEFNVHNFLEHPDILIGQALTLRYKPVNLDVLPLYIALIAAAPLRAVGDGAPAQPDACSPRSSFTFSRAYSTGTSLPTRPARPGISTPLPGN